MEEEGDDEALVCAMEAEGGLSEAAGPPPLEFPEHWSPKMKTTALLLRQVSHTAPHLLRSFLLVPLTLSRSSLWSPL